MVKKKERLPQAKEITIKIEMEEAKKCLKYLPENLERLKAEIEEAVKHAKFWNFLRNCKYLQAVRADFHLTGLLNPPGWTLYCKHPKNKKPYGKERAHIEDVSKAEREKIVGPCDQEYCPIYT
ncbi:MAG: hypothetical protein QXG39_08895 [Candidatus Aenigmatarchaeota archaeon]